MLERVILDQQFNAEEVRKIVPKGSGTDRKATFELHEILLRSTQTR